MRAYLVNTTSKHFSKITLFKKQECQSWYDVADDILPLLVLKIFFSLKSFDKSYVSEVAASRGSSLPARWLLVLGDRESGKTTLLAKLQGNEDPKKGSGLEFGYIEVFEISVVFLSLEPSPLLQWEASV